MRNRVYEYPIGSIIKNSRYERKLYDPVSTGLIVATIGASVYSSQQQKKAAEDAQKAQKEADLEARRIAASKKPMEESATLITNKSDTNPLGTLGLLVDTNTQPRKTNNLGSASTTGLGFGS